MELRIRATQNQIEELDKEQKSLIAYLDSTIESKKKKYKAISDSTRKKLIQMTREAGVSIKKAAKKLRINYSTAKSICQIYEREGRLDKKPSIPFRRNLKKTDSNNPDEAKEEKGGKYSPEESINKEVPVEYPLQCKKETPGEDREQLSEESETAKLSKTGLGTKFDASKVDAEQNSPGSSAIFPNPLMGLLSTPAIYSHIYQNQLLFLPMGQQMHIPPLLSTEAASGMHQNWNSAMSPKILGNSWALHSQLLLQNMAQMNMLRGLAQKVTVKGEQ